MRCYECGGEYLFKKGSIEKSDRFIESFVVEDVEYLECFSCKDRLFDPTEAQKILEARVRATEKLLKQRPLEDFITSTEANSMLDVSRQALHKNRKIREGLVFHLKFNSRIYYLRKSVEKYLEEGDGRFELTPTLHLYLEDFAAEKVVISLNLVNGNPLDEHDLKNYANNLQHLYPEDSAMERAIIPFAPVGETKINRSIDTAQASTISSWSGRDHAGSYNYATG